MMDFTIAVPLIMGATFVATQSGLSKRWAPLFTVCVSMVMFWFWGDADTLTARLFEGFVAALSAMGAYSGAKKTLQDG